MRCCSAQHEGKRGHCICSAVCAEHSYGARQNSGELLAGLGAGRAPGATVPALRTPVHSSSIIKHTCLSSSDALSELRLPLVITDWSGNRSVRPGSDRRSTMTIAPALLTDPSFLRTEVLVLAPSWKWLMPAAFYLKLWSQAFLLKTLSYKTFLRTMR